MAPLHLGRVVVAARHNRAHLELSKRDNIGKSHTTTIPFVCVYTVGSPSGARVVWPSAALRTSSSVVGDHVGAPTDSKLFRPGGFDLRAFRVLKPCNHSALVCFGWVRSRVRLPSARRRRQLWMGGPHENLGNLKLNARHGKKKAQSFRRVASQPSPSLLGALWCSICARSLFSFALSLSSNKQKGPHWDWNLLCARSESSKENASGKRPLFNLCIRHLPSPRLSSLCRRSKTTTISRPACNLRLVFFFFIYRGA